MLDIAIKVNELLQRAAAIPQTARTPQELETAFRKLARDVQHDLPILATLGLMGTTQEMGRQLQQWVSGLTGSLPPPAEPAPLSPVLQACQVLGIAPAGDLAVAEAAYRERVRHDHPDRGGSAERFRADHEAIKTLREYWRTQ